MGKHKQPTVQLGGNPPGCMWGIFQILDYHYWRNVKKILPHKRHDSRRNARGTGSRTAALNDWDSDNDQKIMNSEVNPVLVKQSTIKNTMIKRRHSKTLIRALIAEEMSKKEDHAHGVSASPLKQTNSSHHLDPLGHFIGEESDGWGLPYVLLHNNADALATKLENPPLPKAADELVACNNKHDLSGDTKDVELLGNNPLEEKHAHFPEDLKSRTFINQKHKGANQLDKDVTHHRFDALEIFQVNKDLFLGIRQRIKEAIKKSKKENSHITMDAILHRVPYGCTLPPGEKDAFEERWKESKVCQDGKDNPKTCHDGPVHDFDKVCHFRRTSSLNESLDRYAQLFERSFSRDYKLSVSKSLKLTKEDEFPSNRVISKSFRRILSLHDLESYCSLQNEVSVDALCAGMPNITTRDSTKNIGSDKSDGKKLVSPICVEKFAPLDAGHCSVEHPAGLAVNINDRETVGELSENMDEAKTGECTVHKECYIDSAADDRTELEQPTPVLDFPTSEGLESKSRCIHLDKSHSFVNSETMSSMETLTGSCSTENLESAEMNTNDNFQHAELFKDDADLNYVRYVLELSGFIGKEYVRTWQSEDQPLNPSMFEEVEACFHHEPGCSGEAEAGNCDHQLLFDLVNEALLEIYERSSAYWPKALSFRCRIHAMPVGYSVLEEVWAIIIWYLKLRPDTKQYLDFVGPQDLGKGDGWQNFQFESENVGLELEDLIFDELLEELLEAVCS
ncbi:uncharacterized protein LOC131149472 [Malania oleifera]|uniref:uncharacterized protein LOC131149472 n=1 Tax=Malania oleifera TaxID=397392 RepID=UPI0025AEBBEE|nr:uncharacterized protein LOC131149472 [Malania oleifera]